METNKVNKHDFIQRILFILLLSVTCSVVFAKPVDVEQARKAANTFLKAQNIRQGKKLRLLSVEKLPRKEYVTGSVQEIRGDEGKLLAYVTELNPEGYIIAAADNNIRPILGYSFSGRFPYEDSPQNVLLHLVQWDIEARLKTLSQSSLEATATIQANNQQWDKYLAGDKELVQTLSGATQWPDPYWCPNCGYRQTSPGPCERCSTPVENKEGWITTRWAQDGQIPYPPYKLFFNSKCPYDPRYKDSEESYCRRSSVGCAATAMAQIVNYWQYPGSVWFDDNDKYLSSWWYYDPYYIECIRIDEDANRLHFPGINELRSYVFSYDPSEQPDYPAYLSFAAGIKLHMTYTADGSGAAINSNAYTGGFYYGSAEYGFDLTGYSWSLLWRPRVIENMKKGWPVQIGIHNSALFLSPFPPHGVIVDGYKSTGEFHINCGWAGQCDWWYALPLINTSESPEHPDPPPYYDIINAVVLDICPYQGWSQWGADEKNTFRTPYIAPTSPDPCDKWQVTSRGVYKMTGLVVGTGNKIYAACSRRFGSDPDVDKAYILVVNQYGVRENEIQITNESNDIRYPVQNKRGEIFVAGQSGGIYKIEPWTDNPIPTLYFSEPHGETFYCLKVDPEGWLYAYTPNSLHCIISPGNYWTFSAHTGSQFYPERMPAIDVERNLVYISYYDSPAQTAYLGCLNRLTRLAAYPPKTFPNIPKAKQSTGVPSIGPDGTVYVGCDTKLYAFVPDLFEFRQLWQISPGISAITNAPTIAEDGTIYLAYWKTDTDYVVGAIDSTNGNIKWEIPFYSSGENEYLNVKDLYAASNKVIVFFLHKQVLDGQNVVNTYTLYAYRDNGGSFEALWEKQFGAIGGLQAFGPGATIYVIPQTGDENTLYAISEGARGDPDGGGMGYTNNAAPLLPSSPSPANGAQGIGSTVNLSWTCGDPEGHARKYSIFIGEAGYDLGAIAKNINQVSYVLKGLKPSTGYAWKIIANDGQAVTEGPTWVFATKQSDPDLNKDGFVDFLDFAKLAQHWLQPCSEPGWCGGTDLDWDGEMALPDLQIFAKAWLAGIKISAIRGPLSLDSAWPPQGETNPSWSPDGTKIAFSWGDGYTAWDPSLGKPNPDGCYIVTMTADGEAIRGPDNPLVNDVGWDNVQPDWSPDGNWIVYIKSQVGPSQILKVLVSDSSIVVPITEITSDWHPQHPKWSPDGNNIAFLGGHWNSSYHIWLTDSNGSKHQDITPDITGSVTGLSWSPNGSKIVFTQETDPNLFVLDVATRQITRLPAFPSDLVPGCPVWCSDGNSILFEADGNIYCYRADTQGTAQLIYGPGDHLGDWHPAAGIVFSSRRGCTVRWDSNIYVAEIVK